VRPWRHSDDERCFGKGVKELNIRRIDTVIVGGGQAGLAMKRGVTAYQGLYFLGIPWPHSRKSGIRDDVGSKLQ
jgi:hypothetical protein